MISYLDKTLKVNRNADTSLPLSRDNEALKTVSKDFFKNSLSFSRYGPSFLLIRRLFPRKHGKMCARYGGSHPKEP